MPRCPVCNRDDVFVSYVYKHLGCPAAAPSGDGEPAYTWEAPIRPEPTGIPQVKPCPGCNSGSFAPVEYKCQYGHCWPL